MEVEEGSSSVGGGEGLKVYYFGHGLADLTSVQLSTCSLAELKTLVLTKAPNPQANYDISFNGKILTGEQTSLSAFGLKALDVVQAIPIRQPHVQPSPKQISDKQITHLSFALKTCFLNPAFARTVESLTKSETLETLFAMAPQLRNDPVGIAIIQSTHLIVQFAEPGPLKELVTARPWVVEAFNFIAGTVHGEKTTGSPASLHRGALASQLLNPAVLEEEEEEQAAFNANRARPRPRTAPNPIPQPPLITREQLSHALNQIGGNSLSSLFTPPPSVPPPSSVRQSNPGNSSNPPGSTSSEPVLTGDMVARALFETLNQLPPEQRAGQMDAFREMAREVAAGRTPATQPPTSEPSTPHGSSDSEALRRMREMGIADERLSSLALTVSGGDVEAAVELILSGWKGEGAERMEDETQD